MSDESHRSGFVCVIGRPNVGKSTLVNRLVGTTVSIATSKPQTTRHQVLGVLHGSNFQAVLMDTPGVHKPSDPLNARMVGYAKAALEEADCVLMLVEPFARRHKGPGPQERLVLDLVRDVATPALLSINKIDLAGEAEILPTIAWYADTGRFAEIVPISALDGAGVDTLRNLLPAYLPEGPAYFDPNQTSDQTDDILIGELVRQAVLRHTDQEVPYSVAVQVDAMMEREETLRVEARVLVERDSQKGILIGKRGAKLAAIGKEARLKAESLLGRPLYLELRVAVMKDWSRDPRRLDELGYPEP